MELIDRLSGAQLGPFDDLVELHPLHLERLLDLARQGAQMQAEREEREMQIAARAWDEGACSGQADMRSGRLWTTENPYRKGTM